MYVCVCVCVCVCLYVCVSARLRGGQRIPELNITKRVMKSVETSKEVEKARSREELQAGGRDKTLPDQLIDHF